MWDLTSVIQINNIEKIQERSLRYITNNCASDYSKCLNDTNFSSMEVRRMRLLYNEVFKTLNDLNLPYMKDLFQRNVPVYKLRIRR